MVHHEAVDADTPSLQIAHYHVDHNGWEGIGYHFVIHWDGEIDYVGDIETTRANVYGRNREIIGICLTGDFTNHWPRPEQLSAANSLVRWLQSILPGREIVGHRDIALPYSPTSCPGNTWPEWEEKIIP